MSAMHEQVRELAYRLWQEDGAPEGRAMDYWLQAEAALAAIPVKAKAEPKPKTSAAKPAAAKTKAAEPKAKKSPAKPKA